MQSRTPLVTDSVRHFLVEIGRIPLLTAEQEVGLAQQIVPMMKLHEVREALTESLQRNPLPEEWAKEAGIERSQLLKVLGKGLKARQKMIGANLRLVVKVAKKYQNRGLEFLDLIQEGTLGLHRAAEKFNPEMGYKFSTYAYWWIRQAIARGIAEKGRSVRNPIHITEKINKIKDTSRKLTLKLGRTPKMQEIGDELGMAEADVGKLLGHGRKVVSLSVRIGAEQDTELLELIPDENVPAEFQHELEETVTSLLNVLNPQQRDVIRLRYLARAGEPMSLAEIGRRLKLSRERIRQIEVAAMRKLQAAASKQQLKLVDIL